MILTVRFYVLDVDIQNEILMMQKTTKTIFGRFRIVVANRQCGISRDLYPDSRIK